MNQLTNHIQQTKGPVITTLWRLPNILNYSTEQCIPVTLLHDIISDICHIAQNFGGKKLEQIWQTIGNPLKVFYLPKVMRSDELKQWTIISVINYQSFLCQFFWLPKSTSPKFSLAKVLYCTEITQTWCFCSTSLTASSNDFFCAFNIFEPFCSSINLQMVITHILVCTNLMDGFKGSYI